MKNSPFTENSMELSPTEFEKEVKKFFEDSEQNYRLIEIVHDKKLKTTDQEYQIDVYYEFERASIIFKVLVECKRHKGAITRELVQVLSDKLSETGCHKGILVSTSGFQKGAIAYAKRKGIALLRILNGELLFETKSNDKVNIEKIKEIYNLPNFSFQEIKETEKQGHVTVTLLEGDNKEFFLAEIKNVVQ